MPKDHGDLLDDLGGPAVLVGVLGFLHFQPEVVALACSLADAAKDAVAAELTGDARDHFLNDDGLAYAGPAEQADLSAADKRAKQIDHLDAGLEHFGLGVELGEFWRLTMDG